MKKTLLSFIYFLACIFSIKAQTLFGTTSLGGNGGGTINKFMPATNNLTVAHSFDRVGHTPIYTHSIQASDGKLYGVVANGGKNNDGVLFSFDPVAGTYAKLYDFDSSNGAGPVGNLIQASNGKLYCMTTEGGSTNHGVIFSFDPLSSTFTKLKDFDNLTDGGNPFGSLIQLSNGKLYGMTSKGGSSDRGVIFSFDPLTSTYIKLKEFNFGDGGYPYGSLVRASDGKLYGMTSITFDPGSIGQGAGVIFSLDPSSGIYTKLKDFGYVDGSHPRGSLIQAGNGKLYGMTPYSGTDDAGTGTPGFGVLFSFDPASSTYTVQKYFDHSTGAYPMGDLLQASDGKLYGMTSAGGSADSGVIFSFNLSDSTYTKIQDLNNTNGDGPSGSLMQASDGKLYGQTDKGGSLYYHDRQIDGAGVIFSLDPVASAYTKLHDFGSNDEGNTVSASLVKAANGKLYGMTISGGSHGAGVIFSLESSASTYTKLKDFDIINGANPFGSLIQATDGKLYGVTRNGGNTGSGVIFSFDPSSAVYTKLKDFNNTDGAQPYGSLVQASNGKLYGLTWTGGSNGGGVIFSFDPASSTYAKMKDFDYASGETPAGNLIQASNGKLYGMTANGGQLPNGSEGNIFLIDPLTSVYAVLFRFTNATDGSNPFGSLLQASDGKLYGVTSGGGANFNGVIFSFDPVNHIYTKLGDFDSINVGKPIGTVKPTGNLMQASDGKLYGMTGGGAGGNIGAIFTFDPVASILRKLQDFDYTKGSSPIFGSAFIEVPESGPLPVTLISFTGKNIGINNQLLWKAENEQHLQYYVLQRSTDGQHFIDLNKITAAGKQSYTYDDPISALSLYYYRLKSVDKDGRFDFSAIIKIATNHTGSVVVSPNPFKDRLVMNIESTIQDKAVFILTDLNGKQLRKDQRGLSPGANVIEITETGKLPPGTYLLKISRSHRVQTLKVLKAD